MQYKILLFNKFVNVEIANYDNFYLALERYVNLSETIKNKDNCNCCIISVNSGCNNNLMNSKYIKEILRDD